MMNVVWGTVTAHEPTKCCLKDSNCPWTNTNDEYHLTEMFLGHDIKCHLTEKLLRKMTLSHHYTYVTLSTGLHRRHFSWNDFWWDCNNQPTISQWWEPQTLSLPERTSKNVATFSSNVFWKAQLVLVFLQKERKMEFVIVWPLVRFFVPVGGGAANQILRTYSVAVSSRAWRMAPRETLRLSPIFFFCSTGVSWFYSRCAY